MLWSHWLINGSMTWTSTEGSQNLGAIRCVMAPRSWGLLNKVVYHVVGDYVLRARPTALKPATNLGLVFLQNECLSRSQRVQLSRLITGLSQMTRLWKNGASYMHVDRRACMMHNMLIGVRVWCTPCMFCFEARALRIQTQYSSQTWTGFNWQPRATQLFTNATVMKERCIRHACWPACVYDAQHVDRRLCMMHSMHVLLILSKSALKL